MGRAANLSPLGLYEWDKSLFDLMVIPSALDKDVLINNLLAETAELEVLYPNPVILKNLLGAWSKKQLDVWNRLYSTTQYQYNPIENYNRYETGSETGAGSTTHSGADTTTDTSTGNGTGTRERTTEEGGTDTSTGTESTLHRIAGYDSVESETDDGLVKQYSDHTTRDSEIEYGKTETENEETSYENEATRTTVMTHGEKISNNSNGGHTLHAHGNIGVTTTQKLIREERDIDLFNLYDIIIQDFKMRFCILIY